MNSPLLTYILAVDRYIHVAKITNWIKKGEIVISDRYVPSSWVYQQIQEISLNLIQETNYFIIKPLLTIYLDVPLKERVIRINKSHGNLQSIFLQYNSLLKEQELYKKSIENWDEKRYGKISIIDGLQSITEIHEKIRNIMPENFR